MLWFDPELESQVAAFAFCTGIYVFYSLASTVVSVPYVALIPEVVPDYAQRTSVNAYRSALTLLGTLIGSSGFLLLTELLGDNRAAYFQTGALLGIWVTLPFLVLSVATRMMLPSSSLPSSFVLRISSSTWSQGMSLGPVARAAPAHPRS